LVSFAAAIVVGVVAGNTPETVVWRATVAMVVCWPIGYAVGLTAQRAVNRTIEAHKQAYPFPPDPLEEAATQTEDDAPVEGGEELATEQVPDPTVASAADPVAEDMPPEAAVASMSETGV
jgi:hypothetical protein